MQLLIDSRGNGRCIYGEAIDLRAMGDLQIQRGSHVEPDESGAWWIDLSPVGGPKLGPFTIRSAALAAEVNWLEKILAEFYDFAGTLRAQLVRLKNYSASDLKDRWLFSLLGFSQLRFQKVISMTQKDFYRAIARKTGDSLKTIRRRGFSIVKPKLKDFDPEPNLLPPQVVDWDQADAERQLAS